MSVRGKALPKKGRVAKVPKGLTTSPLLGNEAALSCFSTDLAEIALPI